MGPDKDIIPEEKLLRLIENPSTIIPRRRQKKFIPALSYKGLQAAAIKDFTLIFTKPYILQRLLTGFSVGLTVFLIFDFLKGRQEIDKIGLLKSKDFAPIKIDVSAPLRPLPLSEYMQAVSSRNIFLAPSVVIKKTDAEEAPSPPKITIKDLISQLKLVAVIWSEGNPQVMIESAALNKTFLLNKGDTIDKLKIKDIKKDRVILSYEDEEAELL